MVFRILEAHLDDGVASIGPVMSMMADSSQVEVITVCSGIPDPIAPLTQFTREKLRKWGSRTPAGALARRCCEEQHALCELGRAIRWQGLGLPDVIFRRTKCGVPQVTTRADCFRANKDDWLARTAAEMLQELSQPSVAFLPLGIGGHVDHVQTRAAGERAGWPLVCFYCDQPYYLRSDGAELLTESRRMRKIELTVSDADIDKAERALARYQTQLLSLTRGGIGLAMIARYWGRRIPIWCPKSAVAALVSAMHLNAVRVAGI